MIKKEGHCHCDACEVYGSDRFYCNVCQSTFCGPCWDKETPHKKNRKGPGSIPHEKTRYALMASDTMEASG